MITPPTARVATQAASTMTRARTGTRRRMATGTDRAIASTAASGASRGDNTPSRDWLPTVAWKKDAKTSPPQTTAVA